MKAYKNFYVTAFYQKKEQDCQICIISGIFSEGKKQLCKAKKQKNFCLETYIGEMIVKQLKKENNKFQYDTVNIVYLREVI